MLQQGASPVAARASLVVQSARAVTGPRREGTLREVPVQGVQWGESQVSKRDRYTSLIVPAFPSANKSVSYIFEHQCQAL